MNRTNGYCSRRSSDSALTHAVRLALRQLSEGIGLEEAVQFAAKYHNVTCRAIEAALERRGTRVLNELPSSR